MASAAERRLISTTYSGEKRRWNFEKFVKVHVDQHTIIEGLVEHGHSGIDERSKVRHLMDAIRTDKLDSVKATILSNPALKSQFQQVVTLYKDFIEGQATMAGPATLNISAAHTSAGNEVVKDRYYTNEEFRALTQEQKDALKSMREARGHVPNRKKRKNGSQASRLC
jgi:dihydroorotate dehydrogenase